MHNKCCLLLVVVVVFTFSPRFMLAKYIYIYMVLLGLSCGMPEKAMAPHSSTLAWKIPWMEEPGRLQSMGSLRVRDD